MAFQSTPSWLTKLSSSEVMTARLSESAILEYGTHSCRQCNWRSSEESCCQSCERWKVVDSGSTTTISATRSTKNNCRAMNASTTRTIQRVMALIMA